MMTPKQKARQSIEHRNNGKYAKVYPCYVCGKSAGVDYCSHHDSDNTIGDDLLCLCGKCFDWLEPFDGKTAVKMASDWRKTNDII